jgi:mannose-6-phosphate isomerase
MYQPNLTSREGASVVDAQLSRADYPLMLVPVALEKVWGGESLARLFPLIAPPRSRIGEIWVVWDGLAVQNGALAGRTLKDLFDGAPDDILGVAKDGRQPAAFPLLIKFLDANENLSVQVHPDDEFARAREGQPYGKCEMWYVLESADGASVLHGLKRDLTEGELRGALAGRAIVDVVEQVGVQPGDVLINTPGVVHALGGGVVIFELQQSCDLTYRLYDWDRGTAGGVQRELHLDQGAEVADCRVLGQHKIQPVVVDEAPGRRAHLAACRYFAAELIEASEGSALILDGGRLHTLTILDGRGRVRATEPESDWLDLARGQTCLLPAALGASEFRAVDGECRLIRSFIPDLSTDVVEPLRARGISDDAIAQLGGDLDRSDLWKLMHS